MRVWSVVEFTCLKTLEGHSAPVLCVRFLRLGTQLVSGAADGLVKLWSVKDSEVGLMCGARCGNTGWRGLQLLLTGRSRVCMCFPCQCVNTFEGHEERVWSLAVGKTRKDVVVAPGEPELSVVVDLEIVSGTECWIRHASVLVSGIVVLRFPVSCFAYRRGGVCLSLWRARGLCALDGRWRGQRVDGLG